MIFESAVWRINYAYEPDLNIWGYKLNGWLVTSSIVYPNPTNPISYTRVTTYEAAVKTVVLNENYNFSDVSIYQEVNSSGPTGGIVFQINVPGMESKKFTISSFEDGKLISGLKQEAYGIPNDYSATIEAYDGATGLFYQFLTNFTGADFNIDLSNGVPVNGTSEADAFYGFDVNDTTGQAYHDTMRGFDGDDHLSGMAGDDDISGDQGNDHLYGGLGDDVLNGGVGNDYLNGGDGNDRYIFAVGDGQDIVIVPIVYAGGDTPPQSFVDVIELTGDLSIDDVRFERSGSDLIIHYGTAGDNITLQGQYYVGTGWSAGSVAQPVSFLKVGGINYDLTRGLTFTGTPDLNTLVGTDFDDTLIGLEGADSLHGGLGDDVLNGGVGNDYLNGGDGNDRYIFAVGDGQDIVIVPIVYAGGDTPPQSFVDVIELTGDLSIDDVRFERSGSDLIIHYGTAGDNITLQGQYYVGTGWSAGSVAQPVSFLKVGGINYDLTRGLTFTGTSDLNTLVGTDFDDTLIGGTGADTHIGGKGNDTYYVDDIYDVIVEYLDEGTDQVYSTVTYALSDHVENLTLTGTAAINATGNSGNNFLRGNDGANVLEGLDGDDSLYGGFGRDTASYAKAAAGVKVNLSINARQDTFGAGKDTLNGIENLAGSTFNDALTGNIANNIIKGGGGDDIIEGGDGNDDLYGDAGKDTASYSKAASGVTVNLTLTSRQDTVGSGNDYISGFENLTGSAFNDTLKGNGANNVLNGGDGNDVLEGAAGNDDLYGGNGYDTASYAGATAGVTVDLTLTGRQNTGGAGSDYLNSIENLIGSAYADTLKGKAGVSVLTGGGGADKFVFLPSATNGMDQITDFTHADGDQLVFKGIDYGFAAGHTLTGLELINGAFSNGSGPQFLFNAGNHSLYWDADGKGGKAAVKIATLDGVTSLEASDFLFV